MPTQKINLPTAPREYDVRDQDNMRRLIERALIGSISIDRHASQHALGGFDEVAIDWTQIISGTPSTLAGYGITDAFTKTESDARFAPISHTHSAAEILAGVFPDSYTVAGTFGVTGLTTLAGVNATWIQLDTAFADGSVEGRLQWNSEDGTMEYGLPGGNVTLQVGQEHVIKVKNITGTLIANGAVVYVTGATGNRPTVGLADASTHPEDDALGLATEDIADGQFGYVTSEGLVRDVVTTGMAAGSRLFLQTTPGAFGTTVPDPTDGGTVYIGYVLREHATEGIVLVTPHHVPSMDELSDVEHVTPTVQGQFLRWNVTTGRFELYNADSLSIAATQVTAGAFPDSYTIAGTLGVGGALTVDYTHDGTNPVLYLQNLSPAVTTLHEVEILAKMADTGGTSRNAGGIVWHKKQQWTDGVTALVDSYLNFYVVRNSSLLKVAEFTELGEVNFYGNIASSGSFTIDQGIRSNTGFGIGGLAAAVGFLLSGTTLTGDTEYGLRIQNTFQSTVASYGVDISPTWPAVSGNNYGLHIGDVVNAVTGNYSLYTNAGLVRFGDAVTMASTLDVTGLVSTASIKCGGHIYKGVAASQLTIAGGSTSAAGGNIFLAGESMADYAGDIILRNASTWLLHYDHSETRWEFKIPVVMESTLGVTGTLSVSTITPVTELAVTNQLKADSVIQIGNIRGDDRAGIMRVGVTAATQYMLLGDANDHYVNAPTTLHLRVNNVERLTLTSSATTIAGYLIFNGTIDQLKFTNGDDIFWMRKAADSIALGIYNAVTPAWLLRIADDGDITAAGSLTGITTLDVTGWITATTGVYIGDSTCALSQNVNLLVTTEHGYGRFGPANSSWCHFITDRASYHMDKALTIVGRITNTSAAGPLFGQAAGAQAVNVELQTAAGEERSIQWNTGTSRRWRLLANNTAESGSDAGTNLALVAYNDSGTFIDIPFSVNRVAAGSIVFSSARLVTMGALTASGIITTAATGAGSAGFNLPHGTAPTSPNDGDVWTTTAGLYVRVNGVTVGPLS